MDDFPCTGCSACCRVIGQVLSLNPDDCHPVLGDAIERFPYKPDLNGVCEKLVDNKCSVYSNRPLLCNVKLLGELMDVDQSEWYSQNIKACNALIDSLQLDPSYKIDEF